MAPKRLNEDRQRPLGRITGVPYNYTQRLSYTEPVELHVIFRLEECSLGYSSTAARRSGRILSLLELTILSHAPVGLI